MNVKNIDASLTYLYLRLTGVLFLPDESVSSILLSMIVAPK
jgi:hypothetical protein